MAVEGKTFESGGVGVRVVLAVVSLVIIGVVIAVMLQYGTERQETNHRRAVRISEYGLQTALQKIEEQPSWTEGWRKTPWNGGWYTVSLRRFVRHDTVMLLITSDGTMGAISNVKECLLARVPGAPDSAWLPQNIR